MKQTTLLSLALAAAVGVTALAPRPAAAQQPPVVSGAPAAAPAGPHSPAELLAAADSKLDAEDVDGAAALYDQIAREHAASPEANEARRALKIISARWRRMAAAASPPSPPAEGTVGVVIRREPYSLRTKERLRLTTWEKLDFGTTAFLYGMSVGFSFAISEPTGQVSVAPIALGALVYTAGAVAYLRVGEPDRGDLPLALAITSFVPTTALLVANVANENPNERNTALMTAGVGLLSVPMAIVAARQFDVDPGDMQLVRDAGFWGLALGTTGMFAFGGETSNQFGFAEYREPSDRSVFTGSLLGLYGGLGLGILGAALSDVSLERVRVTTWGGYGGAVIGLLIGASADNEKGLWTGLTIGALGGLVITFLASGGLDGIPPEDVATRAPRRRGGFLQGLTPTMVPVAGLDGRTHNGLGISGTLF